MAFEKLINLANEMYLRGGVALINKRPTPVKVFVLSGFYEAKSTVDYGGCEITRIRHAVFIIFSIQLRCVLWVDSEYKSITLCCLFLEMEWGGCL